MYQFTAISTGALLLMSTLYISPYRPVRIMAENSAQVIKIEDSCSPAVRSLQNREQMKTLEKEEDCFILEFDPTEELKLSKLSFSSDLDDNGEAELVVVAEKGQVVACRDYPHPRHHCSEYPFEKTPHGSHCQLCFCYVCDTVAPCSKWVLQGGGPDSHCHAVDNQFWTVQKKTIRGGLSNQQILHID